MLRNIIGPEMTIDVTMFNIHTCFEKREKCQKHKAKSKGNVLYGSWITMILKSFNRRVTRIKISAFIERMQYFVGFYARSSKM